MGDKMMTPKNLNEKTLKVEIKNLIEMAKTLPADNQVYTQGDIEMVHRPRKLVLEQVTVGRYGRAWFSTFNNGKWSKITECSSVQGNM